MPEARLLSSTAVRRSAIGLSALTPSVLVDLARLGKALPGEPDRLFTPEWVDLPVLEIISGVIRVKPLTAGAA